MARFFSLLTPVLAGFFFCSSLCLAQAVEVQDNPPPTVGKKRATEYFLKRKQVSSSSSSSGTRQVSSSGGDPRYLAIHVGGFLDSTSYNWGHRDKRDPGLLNFGVSYRVGEWVNSMDLLFRAEFTNFKLDEGRAQKLSFLALLTFPDANSRFPLYFGAGLGPGIFTKQIKDESALALDYQIVAGARFFDVLDTLGFQFEVGLKNSVHLLDDGQFTGFFMGVGAVFSF
jgi:hypothetical protein